MFTLKPVTLNTNTIRALGVAFLSIVLTVATWAAAHYLPNALLNGQVMRWHNSTKIIFVTIQPAAGVQGFSNQHNAVVWQAFMAWQQALGQKIVFQQTNDPRLTDIAVSWRSASDGMEIGNQGISYLPTGKVFTNADITLSTVAPTGKVFTLGELKAMALHEIGHALGIKGHSPVASDIMYPSLSPAQAQHSPQQVGLSARDKSTIALLYQQKPAYTNPVGTHLLGFRQFQYYSRLGRSAYNSKQFASAYKHFKTAASYYPGDTEINYYAGISAFHSNQFSAAIPYLNTQLSKSAAQRPSTLLYLANARVQLARIEVKAGRMKNVKPLLQQALVNAQQVPVATGATAADKQQSQKLVKFLQDLIKKV